MQDKQLTVGMPTIVALILSLLAGALQVLLSVHVFAFSKEYVEMGRVLLVFFAGIGITPLVGHAFYAALKLPEWLTHLVTALLAALATVITTMSLSPTLLAVVSGVLTVAAGLGFQADPSELAGPVVNVLPSGTVVPSAAPPKPAEEPYLAPGQVAGPPPQMIVVSVPAAGPAAPAQTQEAAQEGVIR